MLPIFRKGFAAAILLGTLCFLAQLPLCLAIWQAHAFAHSSIE